MAKTLTGRVYSGKKGFYVIDKNGNFAIIDRKNVGRVKEGEEWHFSIVREITDRKGNTVLILKPEKRVLSYELSEEEFTVRCGSVTLTRMSREEALQKGLISIESEERKDVPFWVHLRETAYRLPDGQLAYVSEETGFTERERKMIDAEFQKYYEILSQNEEIYNEYKTLQAKENELFRKIADLEVKLTEVSKKEARVHFFKVIHEPIYAKGKPITREVIFAYDENGNLEAYEEKKEEVNADLPFYYREIETVRHRVNLHEALSFFEITEKQVKELLDEKVNAIEAEKKAVESELEQARKELKQVGKRLETITLHHKRKIRKHILKELFRESKENFERMVFLRIPDNVLPDREFDKLPTSTPQGLACAIYLLDAVPEFLEKHREILEEIDSRTDLAVFLCSLPRWQQQVEKIPNVENKKEVQNENEIGRI